MTVYQIQPDRVEFVEQVLAAIAAEPSQHEQQYFGRVVEGCNTTYCIAGWACHLDPATLLIWGEWSVWVTRRTKYLSMDVDDDEYLEQRAATLLGLSEDDAERVFYTMDNDQVLADLYDSVEAAKLAQAFTR